MRVRGSSRPSVLVPKHRLTFNFPFKQQTPSGKPSRVQENIPPGIHTTAAAPRQLIR
jgi:hypothetical protein